MPTGQHKRDKRFKFPVIPTIVIGLVSLFLNIIFISQNYRNSIVVSVPDGDSLQLSDGRRVRLLGIDAPERDRCMGYEAREYLNSIAKGHHVRLKDTVTDDYGRILANVIAEDLSSWISYMKYFIPKKLGQEVKWPPVMLNRAMVEAGYAIFEGVSSQYYQVLKEGQELAKSNKIGIWSTECRSIDPVSDCIIKANIRAGDKLYYPPRCRYYKQVVVDRSYGDEWFCSESEAREAGFKLTPNCN